jgi:hypothetical protein
VTSAPSRYRFQSGQKKVISFSISHEKDNLLARGLGIEHLRDLLIRLARQIVRQGLSLAYGGHWKETDDNFTLDLLRLISDEQQDNSMAGPDSSLQIGMLYNHSAWPHYLEITPKIEAQWINCCRIIRVTQEQAGLRGPDIVQNYDPKDSRSRFNAAVTASAMRRLSMHNSTIAIQDVNPSESIPQIDARILLGGKMDSYSGFLPGIFEEALVTLALQRPVYLLGGFGGATGVLADAILKPGARPEELTLSWHKKHNPSLRPLLNTLSKRGAPPQFVPPKDQHDSLFSWIQKARVKPAEVLKTGLSDDDTRTMISTRSVTTAVRLVRQGLESNNKLNPLPA